MARRLTFCNQLLEAENIPARSLVNSASAHLLAPTAGSNYTAVLDELDVKLAEHEARLQTMNSSYDTLRKRLGELEEARHVLRETASFFEKANEPGADGSRPTGTSIDEDDRAGLLDNAMEHGRGGIGGEDGGPASFELEFVTGTIDRTKMPTFERVLWRVLRGNLYLNWVGDPLAVLPRAKVDGAAGRDRGAAHVGHGRAAGIGAPSRSGQGQGGPQGRLHHLCP